MKEILYAQGEKEIKKYNYATIKSGGKREIKKTKTQKNLIITNKRIINEVIDEKNVIRNEIPVSSVDFIYSDYKTSNKSLLPSILIMVLGLIFAIMLPQYTEKGLIIGILLIVAGALFLVVSLLKARESVTLVFSGVKNKNNILAIGSSNIGVSNSLQSKTKIKVDREIASKMIEEIGAILIELRS